MAVNDHSPEAVEQRAADLQRSRDTSGSMDNAELFRSAMSDPPAPPTEQPPQQPEPSAAPPPAQADTRERDEQGRFMPRTQPTDQAPRAPAAATQQQPGQPAPATEEDPPLIPSWRLREERERATSETNARMRLEAELAELRRVQAWQQQQLQAQQQQPEQIPDLIADPAAYHAYVEQKFTEKLRHQEANFSFRIQHDRHGEQFEHAYNTMIGIAERGDPSVVRHVMASPDPGAAMMTWYRQASNQARLGQHDPETWAEKVWLQERLKDEKFRGEMLQQIRGVPAPVPQGNGQAPGATYQVPPSLSRIPGAAAAGSPGGDMSDQSLFAYAMRGGR